MDLDLEGKAQELAEAWHGPQGATSSQPALLMVSGLPGTGKSYLSRILAERLPAVVVSSDNVRKSLFPAPAYTADESAVTHRLCRMVVAKLLSRGANVIYDATNLVERQREAIYHLADKAEARLVLVRLTAPEEVVRQRLAQRQECRDAWDRSDAGWEVYQAMRRGAADGGRFQRNVIVVDTSQDLEPAIAKIVRVTRHSGVRRV
ncbi:MAG: ATP-binding protein [Chloroflexi bacterium]|nr:ATP-binding protein [Chloroflexota bacterium]